jgi:hypothetical protein
LLLSHSSRPSAFGCPDGVRWCSLEGSTSGSPPPAISPPESSRSWWCCRSCLLLDVVRGAQPREGWRSSAIVRLQGFSSHSPTTTSGRWSSTRMTTSLVVERSEPSCGLPLPSASRMFIILAGVEGEPSWGPAFRMGWRPASSSSIRGEKSVHQPCGGGELRLRGVGPLQALLAAACLAPRPGWLWCRLRRCLLLLSWSIVVRPPHERWSRRAQVGHIHGFSRATGHTGGGGSYKTSYAAGAASAFLDGLVLTPAVRTGARTSSHALGRLPFAGTALVHRCPLSSVLRWSPPLVRLPTAEVVASAGETVSASCRRASDSLASMASLSPPVGRRRRGPFHSGIRAEVVATSGESSVQRWPPPLASRSELAIPRPYWCGGSSFLQSRDGTRAPLENRCNTFAFCKVLKSTI